MFLQDLLIMIDLKKIFKYKDEPHDRPTENNPMHKNLH